MPWRVKGSIPPGRWGGTERDRPVDPGRVGGDARAHLELRPDALSEEGLVAALTKLAAALSAREGVVFEVDGPGERLVLEPEVEEQLYRVGQEALANVVKHAGASGATVCIAAEDDTVSIEVSDNGRGFDPAAVGRGHFGLRSMRGRVADLGGRLEVRSTPGSGTVLRVEVPAEN